MCTGITVTRRYVPLSRRTNIAGSNIVALAVITRNQGDFQKDSVFLKDGLAKYDVSAG